ncbi:MAG: RNA-binding protein [Bauldia sp.]
MVDDTERRCIVTRRVAPADDLIRFVADPQGWVVPDIKRNLPGRGAWVVAHRQAVAEAVRKNLFARALKSEVKAAAGLADQVAERLAADALATISLARKAGLLVTGFTKVEAAIAGRAAVALIHASDAAADGVRKLEQAARRFDDYRPIAVKEFSSQQLNLALGGTNVIHAALLAGRLSEEALKRIAVLSRYCGAPAASPVAGQLETTTIPGTDG